MNNLETPVLSVDVILFKIKKKKLCVLLHKRGTKPFKDAYALPGVAVRVDETLLMAAKRALFEKLHVNFHKKLYLEQLATFDALYRDVRGRTVSVGYLGIDCSNKYTGDNIIFKNIDDINKGSLPFDHNEIIETAVERLKGKMRYTNIARKFLNSSFLIEELVDLYKVVLNRNINLTNFRNKLLKIEMIEQKKILNEAVGKKGGRPPHLYSFTKKEITFMDKDFLS